MCFFGCDITKGHSKLRKPVVWKTWGKNRQRQGQRGELTAFCIHLPDLEAFWSKRWCFCLFLTINDPKTSGPLHYSSLYIFVPVFWIMWCHWRETDLIKTLRFKKLKSLLPPARRSSCNWWINYSFFFNVRNHSSNPLHFWTSLKSLLTNENIINKQNWHS